MDKNSAANIIANARMNTYQIAHSIYFATVQGVSGANQNDGYGFALSAIAELWNIRGTIGNPYERTKITGRYKGMGVTENMIRNIISRYPKGIKGYEPVFDDLLGIGLNNNRDIYADMDWGIDGFESSKAKNVTQPEFHSILEDSESCFKPTINLGLDGTETFCAKEVTSSELKNSFLNDTTPNNSSKKNEELMVKVFLWILGILFVVLKFLLGWGWIGAGIAALFGAIVIVFIIFKEYIFE